MGNILRFALRPIKNFNIENRALKVVSKEKPVLAPKYKSDVDQLERVLKENPEIVAELSKKDPQFDNRLKDVYVSSFDPNPPEKLSLSRNNPDRPLPKNNRPVEDFEFGVQEPSEVKPGHATLRSITEFINNNQTDPDEWPPTRIAKEYKLKEQDVLDVLKYCGAFQLYIPPENKETKKSLFAKATDKFKTRSTIQNGFQDDEVKKELEGR